MTEIIIPVVGVQTVIANGSGRVGLSRCSAGVYLSVVEYGECSTEGYGGIHLTREETELLHSQLGKALELMNRAAITVGSVVAKIGG